MNRSGCVYLVGAGPGDPALMTVRAVELLQRADVVVHDRLIPDEALRQAADDAEIVNAGKRPNAHTLSQEEINNLLADRASAGKDVVRLKGGDPFVFGRGGEEAEVLAERNIDFEVVPGITAGIAAPAYAGIPLTHRDLSAAACLVTGHRADSDGGPPINWDALAAWNGTLVFYMGVSNLEQICDRLMDGGKDAETPAALISEGTTPHQRVVEGRLNDIAAASRDAGMEPPAVLIVGAVGSVRKKLKWLEKRPLFGRRVVVTRPRGQAAQCMKRLRDLGADPIHMPTICIGPPEERAPLAEAISEYTAWDWILFTSTNGVKYFFCELRRQDLDARALASSRIGAIGPVTAGELEEHGISADLVPDTYTTEGLVAAMKATDDLHAAHILCPRSDIAPRDLVENLSAHGGEVTEVDAYSVTASDENAGRVRGLLEKNNLHWLTFTSSSTVENFFGVIDADAVRSSDARIASIGPRTSETIRRHDLKVNAQAEEATMADLLDAVVEYERNRNAWHSP